MKFKQLFLSVAMVSLLSFAVGCGSGGGGGESSDGSGASGTLSLLLQDAFSQSYKAVYVTITEVQVGKGCNQDNDCDWRVVASPRKTYNLLELRNGVREQLGIADLEAGSYTQMRLIIGRDHDGGMNLLGQQHKYANYVIINNPSNDIHELKVPSGFQTGIKIVHGFVIEENETTELILDFDASKSVVRAGASGLWLLKPTIKVLETASFSIVSGTVSGESGGPGIAIIRRTLLQGALVSAQQISSNDNPVVIASTTSEEDGKYALFIHPGNYYIVGSKIGPEKDPATDRILGYDPVCVPITTKAGVTHPGTNLALAGTKITGTVTGSVSISTTDGTPDQFVTLSFRREVSCGSGSEVVEVKSVNLAAGTPYSEELTPGVYTVHASTAGRFDEQPVTVTGGVDTTLNFEL